MSTHGWYRLRQYYDQDLGQGFSRSACRYLTVKLPNLDYKDGETILSKEHPGNPLFMDTKLSDCDENGVVSDE